MTMVPDIPKVEAAIIEQTNAFRASSKLNAVAAQPQLTKAARDFAQFLAASTRFSHEADGRRPVDRIKAAGYQPCTSAENLAMFADTRGFETLKLATMMVEGWKSSPGHRKNLLSEHATETGLAVVKARREEKYFAVQLFGRPDTLKYSFNIENLANRAVVYQLDGEESRIEPRVIVRHTACVPTVIEFQLKSAGVISKAVHSRFETKDGQVFRLTAGKSGEIVVEVGLKSQR